MHACPMIEQYTNFSVVSSMMHVQVKTYRGVSGPGKKVEIAQPSNDVSGLPGFGPVHVDQLAVLSETLPVWEAKHGPVDRPPMGMGMETVTTGMH